MSATTNLQVEEDPMFWTKESYILSCDTLSGRKCNITTVYHPIYNQCFRVRIQSRFIHEDWEYDELNLILFKPSFTDGLLQDVPVPAIFQYTASALLYLTTRDTLVDATDHPHQLPTGDFQATDLY